MTEGTPNQQTQLAPSASETFLVSDYEYFQKGFELWANHFMGVFYLWAGTVIIPTTAGGLLTNLGVQDPDRGWLFGLICVGVALIGAFISLKMFDIRKAQLNYIAQMNLIRAKAYEKLGITERYGLVPYGKDSNLSAVARRDFGMKMAIVMSFVNALILAVGTIAVTSSLYTKECALILGCFAGVLLMVFNLRGYFSLVVAKVPGKEIWTQGK